VATQIGEFKVPGNRLLRVVLNEYRGRERVDVRLWYEGQDGSWNPGREGVNLPVQQLPELRRLIIDAERTAVERGQLDPADFDEND